MSSQCQVGKAAWMARATTYHQELGEQIAADAWEDMQRWAARGRVPVRVRIMTRLSDALSRYHSKKMGRGR